jgi:hypothetical protein
MCLDEAGDGIEGVEEGEEDSCGAAAEVREGADMMVVVVDKARLMLAQWVVEDGEYARARYFAGQIERESELGREAQDVLSRCGIGEDLGE